MSNRSSLQAFLGVEIGEVVTGAVDGIDHAAGLAHTLQAQRTAIGIHGKDTKFLRGSLLSKQALFIIRNAA